MTCNHIPNIDCALALIDAMAGEGPAGRDLFGDAPSVDDAYASSGVQGGLTREESAIRSCLASSRILLAVVREMQSERSLNMPTIARIERLDHLVAETKAAGRASYRAALLLTGIEACNESKETLLQDARKERTGEPGAPSGTPAI